MAAPPLLFYVIRMQINLTKKEKRVKSQAPFSTLGFVEDKISLWNLFAQ